LHTNPNPTLSHTYSVGLQVVLSIKNYTKTSDYISLLQATICTAVKNSLNNKTNSTNIKYITQTTFISVHAKQKITT